MLIHISFPNEMGHHILICSGDASPDSWPLFARSFGSVGTASSFSGKRENCHNSSGFSIFLNILPNKPYFRLTQLMQRDHPEVLKQTRGR